MMKKAFDFSLFDVCHLSDFINLEYRIINNAHLEEKPHKWQFGAKITRKKMQWTIAFPLRQ